jgi:hypothetical protein
MSDNKAQLWQKIQLTYNALNKTDRWYTGIAIKQLVKKKIFALQNSQTLNKQIESGRWSAYCHYSFISSFQNLLEKNDIDQTKTVLVHPLLPPFLVDEILKRKCKIITLDIDKTTLHFNPTNLSNYLRLLKTTGLPDLIIHFDAAGLYDQISKCLIETQNLVVPSLVIIDNPYLSDELLDLYSTHTLGSILWNAGPSFWDRETFLYSGEPKAARNWYLSWHIETRTRSILEYHLSDSQNQFSTLIEAYFYLLLKDYQAKDFKAMVYAPLANSFLFKTKFKSFQEAQSTLKNSWGSTFQSAIPDIIFELWQISSSSWFPNNSQDILHESTLLRQKAKELYTFFTSQLPQLPPDSLEIPDFYLDKTYLKYFVFTTDLDFWKKRLESIGQRVFVQFPMHPLFQNKPNLQQASLVSQYTVSVDMLSALNQNIR